MILVTGATGYTGRFLVRRLVQASEPVRLLVRASSDLQGLPRGPQVEFCVADLAQPETLHRACAGIVRIAHIAAIHFAPALIAALNGGPKHLVLISSLRRFSSVPSSTIAPVVAAEEAAMASPLPVTILRPSMIFGPGNDRNIAVLASHLRRRRWIPVFGSGRHLQQPVYVENVVDAVVASLQRPQTAAGRSYAIAGAEALSYRALINHLGAALGVRPRPFSIPARAAVAALSLAARLGLRLPLDAEQVRRLQEDKSYDIEPARHDLDYAPLSFAAAVKRIYGPDESRG